MSGLSQTRFQMLYVPRKTSKVSCPGSLEYIREVETEPIIMGSRRNRYAGCLLRIDNDHADSRSPAVVKQMQVVPQEWYTVPGCLSRG